MTSSFATQKAYLQFTSCTSEGLQMEILAGGPAGEFIPSRPDAIARVIADNTETLWLEFFTPQGLVRLPLAEVERAIATARPDVHGESWYERNQPEA